PTPMAAVTPKFQALPADASTTADPPVITARSIGWLRFRAPTASAPAKSRHPATMDQIEPASTAEAPARTTSAHHGALAAAHTHAATEAMISTVSTASVPVGRGPASTTPTPAAAPIASTIRSASVVNRTTERDIGASLTVDPVESRTAREVFAFP